MLSVINAKSLTYALGITVCGVTSYLLYLLLKKEDDDDYLDTLPKVSDYKSFEMQIPKDIVRSLIGRNGKTIKSIQELSNTRINFKENDNDERICIIRGASESCIIAANMIQEIIANQPVLDSVDIWVPQSAVGRIIGRCGENITQITTSSGAKINIIDGDRNEDKRRIIIKGTKDQINLAKSYIEDLVQESKACRSRIESTLAKREPRVRPKSPESPKSPKDESRVEQISPIQGQGDSPFEVYVSAMVDPSRFWLQIVGPKATELDQLVEEMTDYYNRESNRELHVLDKVEVGDIVAAAFQYDNKWYRAEVLNIIPDNQAELYYLDYGDTDVVPFKEVYELRTDFLRLHFQAIECYLAKVEPVEETWSEEAVDKFEEWTQVALWKKLSARINGYCVREKTRAKREGSPVPGIDLFDVNNQQDLDIAQELVNRGFAVFKKDDFKSPSSRATSISNISVISNP